jgi:hypothetical protein
MHRQFERVLPEHQSRVIQTDGLTLDAIATAYVQGQSQGQLEFPSSEI